MNIWLWCVCVPSGIIWQSETSISDSIPLIRQPRTDTHSHTATDMNRWSHAVRRWITPNGNTKIDKIHFHRPKHQPKKSEMSEEEHNGKEQRNENELIIDIPYGNNACDSSDGHTAHFVTPTTSSNSDHCIPPWPMIRNFYGAHTNVEHIAVGYFGFNGDGDGNELINSRLFWCCYLIVVFRQQTCDASQCVLYTLNTLHTWRNSKRKIKRPGSLRQTYSRHPTNDFCIEKTNLRQWFVSVIVERWLWSSSVVVVNPRANHSERNKNSKRFRCEGRSILWNR